MPADITADLSLPIEAVTTELSTASTDIMSWLSKPTTWTELVFVATALTAAILINSIFRAVLERANLSTVNAAPFSSPWLVERMTRLIFPVLTLLLLMATQPIAANFQSESPLIIGSQKLCLIWLLIVFIRAFVTNTLVRAVTLVILVPAAFLHLFDYFTPVAEKLSSYGFMLGDVEITAYTMLKAILVVSIILWIGKFISEASSSYIRHRESLTRSTQELLIKLFDIALYALLAMTTLNLVGIDLTALAVFSGALGVGLGFGLQKIASNFVSGIILLSERSININNLIEMDDGVTGYVRRLGARASTIETFDGKEVMVPNEDFIVSRVANLTHTSTSGRIEIPVGVAYNTDLRRAEKLMLEATDCCDFISNRSGKKPQVFLRDYGDNSVNFMVTFWMDDVTTGRWRAQSDVMFAIWEKFQQHDIEIPFPQRDLHIKSGLGYLDSIDQANQQKASSQKPASPALAGSDDS